ncbi:MAG: hypothetical protein R6U11_01115 [Bacteroidales bacterium]
MNDQNQTIHVVTKKGNGLGVAGFVLSIIGLVLSWLPVVGTIILSLAVIFSFIGLVIGIASKRPIGLSIAGLVISMIFIIVNVIIFGGVVAMSI